MMESKGMLGVGENYMDLMGGEDVSLDYINSLPIIPIKTPYVNQSRTCGNRDYVMACTMMSSYVGLLALFGGDEVEEDKRAILNEGISRGYKIGKGRWTFQGVKSAVKAWNSKHLDKKAMYLRCKVGDKTFNTLLKKGYPLITSRMNSVAYNRDKADNCFIDKSDYKTGHWGHAICFQKGLKGSGQHCNTYPKHKCNVFGVSSIGSLVSTGFYSQWVYAIIPEKNNAVEEAKKRKIIKTIMSLNSALYNLSGEETKRRLHEMNDYFRSNGF